MHAQARTPAGAAAGAGAAGSTHNAAGKIEQPMFEVVSTVPISTPTQPLLVDDASIVLLEQAAPDSGEGVAPVGAPVAASITTRARQLLPVHACLPGLEAAHRSLVGMIAAALQHEQLFAKVALNCPKGVLICGPPGTGKTLLAQTAAADCGAELIVINGPELIGEYLGDSEANLRRVFANAVRKAQNSATVLFIDELDAICPRRQHGQSHENRVVAQLLTLMDGLESRGRLVILAASNRPNALDPAVRRPGQSVLQCFQSDMQHWQLWCLTIVYFPFFKKAI